MIPVRTLIGAKGFETSERCLRSLVTFSADPVRLVVHEDGTLTNRERDRILAFNPTATFISRLEADEQVNEQLRRYPVSLDFRRREILALKLFDIGIINPGPFVFSDSDILFVRPYSGLFAELNAEPFRSRFMKDLLQSYSVRPWSLSPWGKLQLMGYINTGLMTIRDRFIDLDYLEWAIIQLQRSAVLQRRRYWAEQTCWAALAGHDRVGIDVYDPRQFIFPTPRGVVTTAETIAIHFVSTFRNQLTNYPESESIRNEAPRVARYQPATLIGPLRMLASDIKRKYFR